MPYPPRPLRDALHSRPGHAPGTPSSPTLAAVQGHLFFIVGASGVGKDTLIAGLQALLAHRSDFLFARRCITRPADAGGEDHETMTVEMFDRAQANGAFFLNWRAHGLRYGLPSTLLDALQGGMNVIANGSRRAVSDLQARLPQAAITIIEVTASPETLRERLLRRGRETPAEIDERLRRVPAHYPEGLDVCFVANDGTPAAGVAALLDGVLTRVAQAN